MQNLNLVGPPLEALLSHKKTKVQSAWAHPFSRTGGDAGEESTSSDLKGAENYDSMIVVLFQNIQLYL